MTATAMETLVQCVPRGTTHAHAQMALLLLIAMFSFLSRQGCLFHNLNTDEANPNVSKVLGKCHTFSARPYSQISCASADNTCACTDTDDRTLPAWTNCQIPGGLKSPLSSLLTSNITAKFLLSH